MAISTDVLRTSRTQTGLRNSVRNVVQYRELLVALVRKELKVRYKNSVLGFLWSLVNPAITISIYYVIFSLLLKNTIPAFALFLMSGVLIFNMMQNGLSAAVGSIVGNAPLVKKVWFPREFLPLAAVGAAIVDFGLQSTVLLAMLAVFRWPIGWAYLPLIPLAIVVAVLFTTALALWLSAVNVQYRDTQHFLGIALMVWFWGTPIIYGFEGVAKRLPHGFHWLQLLNPYTVVVLSFQRALYNKASVNGNDLLPHAGYGLYLELLAIVAAVSALLLLYTSRVFRRREGDFAEAL
jgi:ABC-2 type transport system permease protein